MFYANFLFTCELIMTLLGVYTCQHSAYRTFIIVVGIIIMFIGIVAGLKTEYSDNMKKIHKESKFKELEGLVEAQSEQINLFREEIEILKHR